VAQTAPHVEHSSRPAEAEAPDHQVEKVPIPPKVTLFAEKGGGMTGLVIACYQALLEMARIVT
jgi:hypothetical protein